MKQYFIFLPIFLFALLQGAFLPLNLVLLTVIFFVVLGKDQRVFLVAFLAGFFLDLAKGTPLGVSSTYLLLASGLLRLYAYKFNSRQPLFLAGVAVFGVLFWSRIFQGFWDWKQGLALGGLGLVVGLVLNSFFPSEKEIKI